MAIFSSSEVQGFLAGTDVVILSTTDATGWPLAMPMWFVVDDEHIGMISVDGLRKVGNLKADPRVCIVAEGGVPGDVKGVVLRGTAEFLEAEERAALADRFHARYSPHVDRLWGGPSLPDDRIAFRVRPRVVRSWGIG